MRVLVTGVKGQLGYDVCRRLSALGIENRGVDVDDFDLTDANAVRGAIMAYAPDWVVHCAAFTNVNRAETERELAYAVNVGGTEHVARACREAECSMVYISTDYVFNGQGERPFETDDPRDPVNYYGLVKSLGEDAVSGTLAEYIILRISWVFGLNGNNFIKTMLRLGRERALTTVVDDQIGSPTYTADLAVLICEMIQRKTYGLFHATNEGFCSWYELAEAVFTGAKLPGKLAPIATKDYEAAGAPRPMNSRLSKRSLDEKDLPRLPHWRDAVGRYLKEIGEGAE